MNDNSWPSGHPDEVEIRAKLARAMEEVPCSSSIRRGDLEKLDRVISLFNAICEFEPTDMYDDMWNLRNHLVPFVPGDEHYDSGCDGDEE